MTTTLMPWRELSARAGRNDMPTVLFAAIMDERLDRSTLAEALNDAWTLPEWPQQYADPAVWSYLFDQVGFLIDGKVHEDVEKPESLVLYRGAAEQFKDGMSWTTDPGRAAWFAHRFEGATGMAEGHVYKITAGPSMILAHFTERNENEWVLDSTEFMDDDIEEVS